MTIPLPPRVMARPRPGAPSRRRAHRATCAAITVSVALAGASFMDHPPAAAQVAPLPVAPSANHPGDPTAWRTFASGDEVLTLQTDPRAPQRLWAGTESGGVVVWDAAAGTFSQHVAPSQPGLGANRVYDIAFDPVTATPWLATAGGVVRADGAVWRAWRAADGLPSDVVRTVTIDGRGTVWAGSDAGIAFLAAGAERFEVAPRDTFTKFSRAAKKGPGATGAADSILDSRGRIWFAHGRDRVDEDRAALSYFDPADGSWRHITSVGPSGNPHNGPQTEQITALAADPRDGSVWAGTWLRGLYHFDGNEWQWHTPQSGLCGKSITALATVGTQLWAACGDDRGAVGTSMWDGAKWSTAPAPDDTPYYTGIGRAAGRVWFAADGGAGAGLSTRDGGAPRTLSTAGALPAVNDITALAVDHRGGVWAGTRGYGLLGYDGVRWRAWTREGSGRRLVGDAITDLAIDGDVLWVATTKSIYDGSAWIDGGVSALDVRTGQWVGSFRQSPVGLPDDDVGSVLVADDGRLWVGLGASPDGPGASGTTSRGNGIAIYDPRAKTWEDHTYASTDRALVGDTVLDLAAGPNGIWAAASHHLDPATEARVGGGVSRAEGERFGGWTGGQDGLDTYHGSGVGRDPLVTGDVRSIAVAPSGDVWAGTYDIDGQRATIASLWPFLDAIVNRWDGRAWHATRFEGDGWVEALALDESGRLWAGTTRGHATSEHAVVGFDSVDKAAGGIRIFDGRTWYALAPAPDTLGIKAVTALAWDPGRGGMWVGTENAGIHYFSARPPTPTPSPSPTLPATATVEPTPTAPASATPTATVPTATPTDAAPKRLFLPFALLRGAGASATRR